MGCLFFVSVTRKTAMPCAKRLKNYWIKHMLTMMSGIGLGEQEGYRYLHEVQGSEAQG